MARDSNPVMQGIYPLALHNPSQTQKTPYSGLFETPGVRSLVGAAVLITYAALNRSCLMCA